MNQIDWKGGPLIAGILLCLSWGVSAQIAPNSADIIQNINVPGMSIVINPGGRGCGVNETWDTSAGGCTKAEYIRNTARVIQVWSETGNVSIGVGRSRLVAVVRAGDGSPVGAGIQVRWSTSAGELSSYSGFTNANSEVESYLSAAKGTAEGGININAWSVAEGAGVWVNAYNSARIAGLYATQTSLLADGTSSSTLVANLVYENGAPVGAGESISWASNFGNLYNIQWSTDGNSQATAQINSSSPGTATITASRNGSLQAQVTFVAPAPPPPPPPPPAPEPTPTPTPTPTPNQPDSPPVIASFTATGYYDTNYQPTSELLVNAGCWGGSGYGGAGQSSASGTEYNVFRWSATGADRFELINPQGQIIYSGSASSWQTNLGNYKDRSCVRYNSSGIKTGPGHSYPFTLRAYKGAASSERTINVRFNELTYDSSS